MLSIQKQYTNSFMALLSLPATAMGFALSVQISALSWILSTKYNLDIHDVGLVWAAGPIAGIIGQVIIGVISDKVWFWNGRRRPFILIGGVLASLMLLALPNIDVISGTDDPGVILGVAIAVALTLDLAINVSFNPTRSIIADVTPEGRLRTKGYTWMQTISGTFGVLAYAIGAYWNNYVLIYFGVGLVFLFSVIPPLFITEKKEMEVDDSYPADDGKGVSMWETLQTIQPLWGFLVYAVYAMIMRLGNLSFDHYYVEMLCLIITLGFIIKALMRSEENLSKEETGIVGFKKVLAAHSFTWIGVQSMFVYMYAFVQYSLPGLEDVAMGRVVSIGFLVFNLVAAILPALVLEPIADKIGRVKTHLGCIAIMALAYGLMIKLSFNVWMIYVIMGLAGVGWAATVSLPFAIMSTKVNKSKMGLYMGLFNLSVVLPQLVASLGIGEIVSATEDKSILFVICSVSLLISAILWIFVKEEKQNPEKLTQSAGGH